MAIKLGNLSRWQSLNKGASLKLPGIEVRLVRLNVNSPGTAILHLANGDGEIEFLAAPVGCDTVEFYAAGDLTITTESADVKVYAAENEPAYNIEPDGEAFTKIMERAPRNPELEQMMYLSQVNIERRMAQVYAEIEQKYARENERNSSLPVDSGANAAGDAPVPTGPDANGEPPVDGSAESQPAGSGNGSGS